MTFPAGGNDEPDSSGNDDKRMVMWQHKSLFFLKAGVYMEERGGRNAGDEESDELAGLSPRVILIGQSGYSVNGNR